MRKLVFVFGFFVSFYAYARPIIPKSLEFNERGNGGDIVFCKNDPSKNQILDFYEADFFGIKIELGGDDLSVMEKVKLAISRLDEFEPLRAEGLRSRAEQFFNNVRFTNVRLKDVPDSDEAILPPLDCSYEQIALQKEPEFPRDRLYTINKDLWDSLDKNNQAGLVLHEIILNEAVNEFKHQNSRRARYLNAVLASNELQKMNDFWYNYTMESVKMQRDIVMRNDTHLWTFIRGQKMNAFFSTVFCTEFMNANIVNVKDIDSMIHAHDNTPPEDRGGYYFFGELMSREVWLGSSDRGELKPALKYVGRDFELFRLDQQTELNFVCVKERFQ